MCTRYVSPEAAVIESIWRVGRHNPWRWPRREIFPGYEAPFIRADRESTEPRRELGVGRWNLIPWFATETKVRYSTSNARAEELSAKATYQRPWARGRRCIIPALCFYEPNWETGRHIPWRFLRADGQPWSLAGVWNTWTNKVSGEIVESYTMLTTNADNHPLMERMHRPDPKRPPNRQDKRSVVPIDASDIVTWLYAPQAEAAKLIKVPAVELFDASPGEAHE